MFDPVNNFKIPDEWIKLSRLPLHELKEKIESGLYVLLSDGKILKRGLTTGTIASCAAKASVLSLKKEVLDVSILTPCGIRMTLPVIAKNGKAIAKKESGDHASDVTRGIEITAQASECDDIIIKSGKGIGLKKGLPAINPYPMHQIKEAIKEGILELGLKGACVLISAPNGEVIAKKTLNEKIGIIGGISILGTTGFVEPWNEHLGETKKEIIKNSDKLVLTTGRFGVRYSNMLFPEYNVVLIGSDISSGLKAAKPESEVIIAGLPALILKWGYPDILKGSGYYTIQEMINDNKDSQIIDMALSEVVKKSGKRIVLFNRDGTILKDKK